jgi:putative transposase
LWRQAGLQVTRRRPRQRVAMNRPRPLPAAGINYHVWACDFVFDTCANGQTPKCLSIVDEWTRECLAIDVAGGIRSGRVTEVLTQLSVHGTPRYLRSDNRPEFVARAILRWLTAAQIETALIEPGKPWQNATDESFNGALWYRLHSPKLKYLGLATATSLVCREFSTRYSVVSESSAEK